MSRQFCSVRCVERLGRVNGALVADLSKRVSASRAPAPAGIDDSTPQGVGITFYQERTGQPYQITGLKDGVRYGALAHFTVMHMFGTRSGTRHDLNARGRCSLAR